VTGALRRESRDEAHEAHRIGFDVEAALIRTRGAPVEEDGVRTRRPHMRKQAVPGHEVEDVGGIDEGGHEEHGRAVAAVIEQATASLGGTHGMRIRRAAIGVAMIGLEAGERRLEHVRSRPGTRLHHVSEMQVERFWPVAPPRCGCGRAVRRGTIPGHAHLTPLALRCLIATDNTAP